MTEPSQQQQEVISYALAPLRVAAGAGTGKTATMADRLATFVKRGEIEPEEALGITFTNKAAGELADRVRRALPELAAEGREVEITTYHGFAHGLLREFGPLVGVPREVRIVTPGYTRQLMADAIAMRDRPDLDLTRPGALADRLARLASSLGDHLRDAADLRSEDDHPVAEERNALAAVLEDYRDRKRALGVVDFADLVNLAHRLVASNAEIAARIRNRYRLVLLDEYQDTNPGQRQLLRELFGGGFPITAVGDSDQTIYEWRGATPHNFAEFANHFPDEEGNPAKTLHLSVTWRNDRKIVAVANAVRAHLRRPNPLGRLEPRPEAAEGRVVTHWLSTATEEARWIAAEVGRLHDEGTPWREIAILFRKHRQMAAVRDALEENEIPLEVASLGGLLEVPEVVELHSWLRILGRPDDAVAAARILTGGQFRLGLGDLAPLAAWVSDRAHSAEDDVGVGWALLEAVDEAESVHGLSSDARDRVLAFRALYRELLVTAQGLGLVDLCRTILDRTAAWHEVEAMDPARRLSTRLNLYRFLDLAEEWSPLEGGSSLQGFLDHLDLLAEDAASGELDTAHVSGEDAVALLTVHRAKGLEWDAVFIPGVAERVFPSGVLRYEDSATVASVLPHHLRLDRSLEPLPEDPDDRKEILKAAHGEQEWRTAYVAVTRARHHLYASGAHWTGGARPRAPSDLFAAIDAEAEPAPGRCTEAGERPKTARRSASGRAPDPLFEDGFEEALRSALADPGFPRRIAAAHGAEDSYDRLVDQLELELSGLPDAPEPPTPDDGVTTSVTGLVTLATCPRRFQWSEVERMPRRSNPAALRGVEVHRRIELHNRGSLSLEEAGADSYDASGEHSGEGAFAVFRASRFASVKPLLVEAPFTLSVGGNTVSGRIDAVYGESDEWELVDFKTGRPRDDDAARVQLQVYAVAAASSGLAGLPAPKALAVTFAFLGGGELTELTEAVDDAWIEDARRRVESLLDSARSNEGDPSPTAACRHCDFSHFCAEGRRWLEVNA